MKIEWKGFKKNKKEIKQIRNKKEKKENEQIKEYKINLEKGTAKLTTNQDNIIKVEFPKEEMKKRKGYIEENTIKKVEIKKYYDNFFKNKNKLSKNYYRLFLAMFVLAIISTAFVLQKYNVSNMENFVTYSLDKDQETVKASSSIDSKDMIKEAVLKEENIKQNIKQEEKKNTVKKEEVVVPKLEFCSPLNGEISKIYSIDKVIYSKTLESWKTHDGVDIKGEIGTGIVSIEKGKVEKVYEDSFLGYTVIIDHGQGYQSVYANLGENIPVKVGQIVTKKQLIGQISNTSIGEIKDEPHVHFMLMKDNAIVDPTYVLRN